MPDEFVLVPKVATEGMKIVGGVTCDVDAVNASSRRRAAQTYEAMLSAAPAYEITEDEVETAWSSFIWARENGKNEDESLRAVLTQFVKRLGGK